jgi:hypothetical protein
VTIPSVTVLVAGHGQINWFDAIGRQSRIESREMFWR